VVESQPSPPISPPAARRRAARRAWALALLLPLAGCGLLPASGGGRSDAAPSAEPAAEVYRRADADRVRELEEENERLRADVRAAEETLVAVESGMRGEQTRTEAVSRLAEARIQVDRAAQRAPWRADAVAEARRKLADADRQLGEDHVGSAIFFVSRASRIAKTLLDEADLAARTPGTRYVKSARTNLRKEPALDSEVVAVLPANLPVFPESAQGDWVLVRTVSGQVGFVHTQLLTSR
jgi:hypothetical protein